MTDTGEQSMRAWPRVRWTRAAQVAPLLGPDVLPGPIAPLPPNAAFAILRRADPANAVRFAAHCLSRVDAARWMTACIAPSGGDVAPARAVAVKAVRRWVASPSDEARRLAFEAGTFVGWETMEGMACLAIFLSGGSMAPPGQDPPVNPPPGAFGDAAAGAVLFAAYAEGAPRFADRVVAMLNRADAIAAGEATS